MRVRPTCLLFVLGSLAACSTKSVSVTQRGSGGNAGSSGENSSAGMGSDEDGGRFATSTGGRSSAGSANGGTTGVQTEPGAGGGTDVTAGGTSGSALTSDPCANVVCAAPPGNTCSNETTAVTYSSTGTCKAGVCEYSTTTVNCEAGAVCASGACSCPSALKACGAACVDLQSSADNCGACGHGCLGGSCKAGRCTEVTLSTHVSATEAIALSTGFIYVARANEVDRVSKNGGALEPLAVNLNSPRSVDADGESVFWGGSSASNVRRLSLTASTYSDLASATLPVESLLLYGDWVYYVEHSIFTSGTSYVYRVKKSGGTVEPIASSASGAKEVSVVGDCVYYLAVYLPGIAFVCPGRSGTLPTVGYVSEQFAADNTGVYFADTQGLKVATLNGAVATTLVPSVPVRGIALDATHVYYIQGTNEPRACGTNWQLWRVRKTGGTPAMLIDSPMECPMYPKVDSDAVYYHNSNTNTLAKVAK